MQVPFAQVLGRFTQKNEKKAPGERQLLGGLAFIASFWRSLCYTCFAVHPRYLTGEGVKGLNHLLTILESVVANVISHYICKWLGKLDKNRKPD